MNEPNPNSNSLRSYAARIEYDGAHFSGWQRQKGRVRTIQGELEAALSKVANTMVTVITAGRTDAGVHSTHQVIHFQSSSERSLFAWIRGANRFLPHDIRVHWVHEVSNRFHARFSALSRSYRFIIYNRPIASALYRNYATHEFRPLDVQAMSTAGELLLGEHDFSSFRAAGCQAHSPIRTVISFSLEQSGSWIWFDIKANAFLQHMVRNIAGSLIEVGYGKRDKKWFSNLLNQQDRTAAGITAKANGLYLIGVEYSKEFALPSTTAPVVYWTS